jgi:hypothetical protein
MPILYVHGVNTRSRDGFMALKPYLERYIAPVISRDPGGVTIDDAYWGEMAAKFAWDGASRPRSRLLGQGAENQLATVDLLASSASSLDLPAMPTPARPSSGGLISGTATTPAPTARLSQLSPDELSNYLALLVQSEVTDPSKRADISIRADDLAHDEQFRAQLAAAPTAEGERSLVLAHLRADSPALVGMGAPAWVDKLGDRIDETLRRAADLPAFALATVAGELRKPLNDFVSFFLGDVLAYLRTRGTTDSPGPIPKLLLGKLRELSAASHSRGGEPIILLSHSMGGQLVYDLVTAFLPADPELATTRVDFWCATASQVGFFEEMKLFLASNSDYRTGHEVPFPALLGGWWNVWDYDDFVSYTVRDIFAGVDDGNFDSGMSLLAAHSGYLQCPSFFRRFGDKITTFLKSR